MVKYDCGSRGGKRGGDRYKQLPTGHEDREYRLQRKLKTATCALDGDLCLVFNQQVFHQLIGLEEELGRYQSSARTLGRMSGNEEKEKRDFGRLNSYPFLQNGHISGWWEPPAPWDPPEIIPTSVFYIGMLRLYQWKEKCLELSTEGECYFF